MKKLLLLLVTLLGVVGVNGQTVLISPTVNNGGFESGATVWGFAQTTSGTNDHKWVVGNTSTPFAGSNAAYITTAASGNPWSYVNTVSRTSHCYQDITFPAGETQINLSFYWKSFGESGWDRLLVYLAPTSVTPTAGTPASNSTALTGATLLWTQPTYTASSGSTWTQALVPITAAQAGNTAVNSTMRIIFTWQNDNSIGTNPPGTLDDIMLVSSCPGATATAATSILATGATLNWNVFAGATGYNVRYKRVSDAASVSTWASPTFVSGGSSTNLAVSSLSASTLYEYQVASNAGCTAWSPSSTFTTLCNLASLTQMQGFNTASTNMPPCWSLTTVATVGTAPAITAETSGVHPSGQTPFEGTRFLRFNSFSCGNGSQMRLVSLPLTTSNINSVDVVYYWLHDNTAYTTSGYLTEGVQMQYSTNGTSWTDVGAFVPRLDGLNSSAIWYQKNATLPTGAANQNLLYVGFLFTSRFGNDCHLDSVTILPSTPVTPTGVNTTQCASSVPVVPTCFVVPNTGWASHTYKWYTVSSGGTAIPGENGPSLTTYTVGSGTTTFYVAESNGNLESSRVAVTATVNLSPSVSGNPGSITICSGTSTTLTTVASGTTLSYQWQENTGSGFANITNGGIYSNATTTALTLSNVPFSMNGYQYRCYVSGICTPAVTSAAAVLTVNGTPTVTVHPTNTTACPGATAILNVTATGTSLVYQWQENTGGGFANITNGGIYSGATTSALTITGALISMSGFQYRCYITGICSPAATSLTAVLTVNNSVTVSQHPQNSLVCGGVNTTFNIVASGSGLGYQWQVNDGTGFANVSNGALYNGVATSTLGVTAPPTTMDGYLYRCVVTSACTAPFNSNTALLTVNFAPAVTSQPTSSTGCQNTNVSFSVTATGGGLQYLWQVNTGSGFANIVPSAQYSGVNQNTLNVISTQPAMSGYQYRCFVSGNCAPPTVSATAVLTVLGAPTIVTQPSQPVICAGGNASFTVNATGTALVYQWQESSSTGYNNIANGGIYGGATTATLTLTGPASSMTGTDYRCVISGTCLPTVITQPRSLLINTPATITGQPVDAAVCVGSNTSFMVQATAQMTSPMVYQWQYNDGLSGFQNVLNSAPYSGANGNILTITNASVVMTGYTFRCIITSNCTPVATTNIVKLIINTLPAVVTNPVDVTLCPQSTAIFNVVGTGTGLVYRWQVNTGSGYVNLTDNATYSNTNTASLRVATATTLNNYLFRCVLSGACLPNAISTAARLSVLNPVIVQAHTITDTVCEGGTLKIGVSATGQSLKYQWQRKLTSGGYIDLVDIPPYSGVNTDSLRFTGAPDSIAGFIFRCRVYETQQCNLSFYTGDIPLGMYFAPATNPGYLRVGPLKTATFAVPATGSQYQWQVNKNDGGGFVDLTNSGPYSNVTTSTLFISPTQLSMSEYKFRCVVDGICKTPVASKFGTLVVDPALTVSTVAGRSAGITVYPNPLEGTKLNISVTASLKGATEVKVTDKLGKVVYTGKLDFNSQKVNSIELNALAAGVYTLQIINQSESVIESVRFTKQ
jgi:hypothetical protein